MSNSARRGDLVVLLCLVLLLVAFAAWQTLPAQEFEWKYDEGVDVVKASLLLDGYELYRDIWCDQTPLFTFLLAGVWRLCGESVFVARMLVLALSLVGLASLHALARHVAGDWASLGAVVMLIALPELQHLSRLVLIGWPAVALAILALALAAAYAEAKHAALLALSGLVFAASLLIKPLAAPMFAALLWLVWRSHPHDGGLPWRPFTILAASMLVPALAALAYGRTAFLDQVIGVLLRAREVHSISGNATDIYAYLTNDKYGLCHIGLVTLAIVGLISLAQERRWTWFWTAVIWLVPTIAALLWHTPLRRHEIIVLMPPLAFAAAAGLQRVCDSARRWARFRWSQRWVALLGALGIALWLAWLPAVARESVSLRDESVLPREKTPVHMDLIRFLQKNTPEGSALVTDEPMLAYKAERFLPPSMVVASYRRIEAGELGPELTDMTTRENPSAIALWRGVFERVPGYADWVRGTYALVRYYEPGQEVYMPVPKGDGYAVESASCPMGMSLVGSWTEQQAVEPGQELNLRLYWRCDAEMSHEYTMFAHLLDADGSRLAGWDGQPLDGALATDEWSPGTTVSQLVTLSVPADAAPGRKLISVGWYDRDGHRLEMVDGAGEPLADKQIVLGYRPVVLWPAQIAAPDPERALGVTLGDVVRLIGYALEEADSQLDLTLHFACLAPIPLDYTVFCHLLNERGEIVSQVDRQPGQGNLPTSAWRPGEFVSDQIAMPMPDNLEPGEYALRIGLYDWLTDDRLPVSGPTEIARGDHILLEDVVNVSK